MFLGFEIWVFLSLVNMNVILSKCVPFSSLCADYCFLLSDIQTYGSEWFFFSPLYKRNTNCNQLQRKTNVGYWKSTGPDRDIKRGATEEVIGTKKTLVFHMGSGRGHEDVNTGWVIHEYRARMAALPANVCYPLTLLSLSYLLLFHDQGNC